MRPLEAYQRKRDFKKTKEPPARLEASGTELRFVIQQHAATRLHYDLRLEMDGVYKSWAVPKGPSLDANDRRMAIEVEDHPLAYGTFEGTIPKGEYGGGTVLLWDRGAFIPDGDPLAGLSAGKLTFRLEGEKLHGAFHLVRMRSAGQRQRSWLLFKAKDEHAKAGANVDKLAAASVKTGRSLDEIARVAPMPSVIEPQLCRLVDAPPRGADWIHEPKIDGYRVMVRKEGDDVRLFTRGGLDWTDRFPEVAAAARALPVGDVILDGEIAVHDGTGRVRFEALQRALSSHGNVAGAVCHLFDCLFLEGQDLRALPLLARKQVLLALLEEADDPVLVPVPHQDDGEALFAKVKREGLEGVVSKRKDAPYQSRRSDAWRKVKAITHDDFVVVGWTDARQAPRAIGALLLARRADDGALAFAGKVGTGWSAQDQRALYQMLAPIERDTSALTPTPRVRSAHWVEPHLVVEVAFGSVTRAGILRHASYQGIRVDKSAAATEPRARARAPLPRGAIEVLGVTVTNAERVVYDEGAVITKGMLAAYVAAIGPLMLPFVRRRPLAVVRCPQGSRGHCFFQKHPSQGMPDVVRSLPIPEGSGADAEQADGLMVDDVAGLVGLVQMGVLEIHPWGAAPDHPDRPDRVIFDLDPAVGLPWSRVCDGAREVRARLAQDGLTSFVKSTGGKGLHVEVPLNHASASSAANAATWDDVKQYARAVAQDMERAHPERYTCNARKAARAGRVFVDYLRNGRGATAVAPYSMRANPRATVAVPLAWDEIDAFDRASATVLTMHELLDAQQSRPWAGYFTTKQRLPRAAGARARGAASA